MNETKMSDRELNGRIALALGWTLWEERRGIRGDLFAVWQRPGERKPWERTQKAYQKPEAYRVLPLDEFDRMKHIDPYWPEFAKDGNGAVSLIEKMRERYWFCTMATGEDSYEAKFHGGGGDGQEIVWSGEADTLPRAVAEAAYAALTAEEQV